MEFIPFCQPTIELEEEEAVLRVLRSGWLVEGSETARFEKELASYLHASHVIAVGGATEALFLLLKAYDIGSGDDVVVPSLTFAATAEVVTQAGANVIFADVTPYPHLCLDPVDVMKRMTPATKAIIPVHYAGNHAFTDYKGRIVLEDSAHLIGPNCVGKNSMAFSFHATKNMTTARGGAIAIADRERAAWLKKARNFGITQDVVSRHKKGNWRYEVEFTGYSSHLIDVLATIGRVQLTKLDTFLARRKVIRDQYNRELKLANQGLHLYPILVQKRDQFMQYMLDNHIQCSVHFQPLHTMPAFKAKTTLPVTELVGQHIVSLPLYPALSDTQIVCIATLVRAWHEKHGRPE